MHIQSGGPFRAPAPQPAPQNDGGGHHHHDHGWVMPALHVGHDIAMIGMALPGGHNHAAAAPTLPSDICTSTPAPNPHAGHSMPADAHAGHAGHSMPADPHAGHGGHSMPADPHAGHAGHGGAQPPAHDHGGGGGSLFNVNNLTAGLSAVVALGSAVHGVQMIAGGDKLEGANHLVMSAGCGVMAAQMLTNNPSLGPLSVGLMAAHGLGEVALGVHQIATAECSEHRNRGIAKAAHGGFLAAAQLFPAAALPLYLAMGAATAADIALSV